jgi:hypothetical protein
LRIWDGGPSAESESRRDSLEPNIVRRFCEEKLASELAEGGFELKSFTVSPYGHAIAEATGPDVRQIRQRANGPSGAPPPDRGGEFQDGATIDTVRLRGLPGYSSPQDGT